MRPFEQLVEQPEFGHHFERRRMDRVAAKVAQEVGMLFEYARRTPARARSSPAIIPAGPPPTMQQSYFVGVTATMYCSNGSAQTPILADRRGLGTPPRSPR